MVSLNGPVQRPDSNQDGSSAQEEAARQESYASKASSRQGYWQAKHTRNAPQAVPEKQVKIEIEADDNSTWRYVPIASSQGSSSAVLLGRILQKELDALTSQRDTYTNRISART